MLYSKIIIDTRDITTFPRDITSRMHKTTPLAALRGDRTFTGLGNVTLHVTKVVTLLGLSV